jgi:hypothetical protein
MNVCSADRDIPSLHYPALPCLQLYFISLAYTKPTLIYDMHAGNYKCSCVVSAVYGRCYEW